MIFPINYSPLYPHVPTSPSIMRFRRRMLRRLLMPQLGLRLRRRKRRRLRSARSWGGSLGRDGFGGGFPQRWPFCGRLKLNICHLGIERGNPKSPISRIFHDFPIFNRYHHFQWQSGWFSHQTNLH